MCCALLGSCLISPYLNFKVDINNDCKYLYRKVLKALVAKFTPKWKDQIQSSSGGNKHTGNKLSLHFDSKEGIFINSE